MVNQGNRPSIGIVASDDAIRHDAYPLTPGQSVLIVVDFQESLVAAIASGSGILARAELLIRCATELGVPIVSTTQNVARLGAMSPRISAMLRPDDVIDKMAFSAFRCDSARKAIERTGAKQAVVCGLETHICVAQTAIDLSRAGYATTVVADAVGSRSIELHKLGMERIRDLGVFPAAAESVVYEWLGTSESAAFRAVLRLVKAAHGAIV